MPLWFVLLLAGAPPGDAVRVVLETDLGAIVVEVDQRHAPLSAANWLRYVDAGLYNGGVFHRTVKPANQPANRIKIEVIQGGRDPAQPTRDFPPIPLERTSRSGLRHLDGSISMARDGPDTATADFFICLGDQPALDYGGMRNPDGQGFAAFGRVVEGLDIVRRIHAAPAVGQALRPPVRIRRAARLP